MQHVFLLAVDPDVTAATPTSPEEELGTPTVTTDDEAGDDAIAAGDVAEGGEPVTGDTKVKVIRASGANGACGFAGATPTNTGATNSKDDEADLTSYLQTDPDCVD